MATVQSPIVRVMAAGRRQSIRSTKAEVRRLRRQLRRQAQRYGNTPAEVVSRKLLVETARAAVRALWMGRKGRKIDLAALLRERRADGKPLWALVDPTQPPNHYGAYGRNGQWVRAGSDGSRGSLPTGIDIPAVKQLRTSGKLPHKTTHRIPVDVALDAGLTPTAIPPLPAKARKIATDPKIRRRALWVGLLYQPDEWMEVRPDPAVVVEWHDRPGEYYVLCVWGADTPRIMEFVD